MKIRIGGVPEHFNYPWHYAMEKGYFNDQGVELLWNDFPGGTGAMAHALKNQELDFAILLTEGAVKEVSNGANFKIASTFVQSPLIWGIHTASQNTKASLVELSTMKYAISRIGSGSHLMAFVHAKENGQIINQDQMEVINDLDGALKSLQDLRTDLFLWEKYTTSPFVDKGILARLGEFVTPWPCFVLVANDSLLSSNPEVVEVVQKTIATTIVELTSRKESLIGSISEKYHLSVEKVSQWLDTVLWSSDGMVSTAMLSKVQHYLKELNLSNSEEAEKLVYDVRILN